MLFFRHRRGGQHGFNYLLSIFILIGIVLLGNNVLAIGQGGIGGRPAYPRADNPRTESIFIHTLKPGAVQKEGVLLTNNTDETKTLQVYAVDSMVSSGGAFACRQMTEPKKDVGKWIVLKKSEITLKSATSKVVPFDIIVPKNTSVGEHNGCIVIQEKKDKNKKQTGLTLSFRTGLRVAITVPGKLKRKLEIIGFNINKKENGNFLLRPKVKNLGNTSIDADIKVITRYFFGLIYAKHGGQFPILRGEISDWNFELKKPFWGGWYRAKFIVNYDINSGAGIGVKSGKKLTQLVGPTIWFFSFPSITGLIIELIILLVIIGGSILFWISQKRKKWMKNDWIEYAVKPGEDVKLLAERCNVSWKILAKGNKLQPPYALKTGQKIKIPPTK